VDNGRDTRLCERAMIASRWKLRPQYRLRTLLIGITAVSLLLTAIPFEARQYRHRKARVHDLISGLGGSVEIVAFGNQSSPGSNWLSTRLGYVEDREALWSVDLRGCSLASGDIDRISRCEWIVILDLSNTNISDDYLEDIARLARLQVLRLKNTPITDAGIASLRTLDQLSVLDVAEKAATYECLARLEQEIRGTNFQEQLAIARARTAGIKVLTGMPASLIGRSTSSQSILDMVWQRDSFAVTKPEGADSIQLTRETTLTPAHVEDLRRLVSARSFEANGVTFPQGGLQFLAELTNLESVSIDNAQAGNLTDDDLQWLAELPSLIVLDLYSENLTDRGIAHLADASRLASLSLSGNRFTVSGLSTSPMRLASNRSSFAAID
jgi:hypothetical protein